MTSTLRSGGRKEPPHLHSVQSGPASAQMDAGAIKSAYRRWAPVYDNTFGRVSTEGRGHAVEIINQRYGRVLEVGVGTGLSLPNYGPHLEIIGMDLSPEMLDKARKKVERRGDRDDAAPEPF